MLLLVLVLVPLATFQDYNLVIVALKKTLQKFSIVCFGQFLSGPFETCDGIL